MNRLRLGSQLLLAAFVPLVLFALVAAGIAAYALASAPRELALQRQASLSQMAAAGVAAHLRGYARLLESVSGELAANAGDLARQQEIMAERTQLLGRFTAGTTLLDARGTAVAVTAGQEAAMGLNYAFRPYFQQVRTTLEPAFSTVIEDRPGDFGAVVIAVPMLARGSQGEREFSGVLLGEFALQRPEWAAELDLLRTELGGQAYLVDSGGTIIYHPEQGRIGSSLREEPALWSLAGPTPRSAIVEAGSGVEWITGMAPVPDVAWYVVAQESWSAVSAPLLRFRWAAAIVLATGIVLALATVILTLRSVTRSLAALMAEAQHVTRGGSFRPLRVAGPADVRGLLAVVNQMVTRLAEQRAALRSYAQQVLRGQEEERLRLARELHDETVQDLVGLAREIELAAETIDDDRAAAEKQFSALQSHAYATASSVRRMSQALRPSLLEDLGLEPALQMLARDLGAARPGLKVHCETLGAARRLAPELELTAYRVAQEALTNVRRHAAGATRVEVMLSYEPGGIELRVEDNGPGFEIRGRDELLRAGRLGLAGMAERAELFGGAFEISSTPGEGTAVTLRLVTDEPGADGDGRDRVAIDRQAG